MSDGRAKSEMNEVTTQLESIGTPTSTRSLIK